MAYKLALLASINHIHNVFYVSLLRKYKGDHLHVLRIEDIELLDDLSYEEKSMQILDKRIKELRNKRISLVNVLRRIHKLK